MQFASVVDLFCGVGGMAHGFVQEHFNVVAGIDVDESCRYPFERNNGAAFIRRDVARLPGRYLAGLYPPDDITILVGCAPCQPFSRYTVRTTEDDKWKLLRSFARLIKQVRPDIVSMENVPELLDHKVYVEFMQALESEGYFVSSNMVYCPDYGIPQTRERLVLLASRFGEMEIIKPTHRPEEYRTVQDVIRHLEPISAGQVSAQDPLHRARGLRETNMRRIMNTPPGGGWKDWPEELLLECHKKTTGQSYVSVYGRMEWGKPAPTMTTHCGGLGNGRFGHPEQHRAISLREAALFQTFPMNYEFIPPDIRVSNKDLSRHIGNAVPVRLGLIIAKSIKNHLRPHYATKA
ncbi:MAG: (cytosine-5)-methyltransferase 1 [Pyrinomonadaceae bacterium]|nr:(cytosine-5)-methyltransferase 1 [Pyrinomonadaceae bacterium]